MEIQGQDLLNQNLIHFMLLKTESLIWLFFLLQKKSVSYSMLMVKVIILSLIATPKVDMILRQLMICFSVAMVSVQIGLIYSFHFCTPSVFLRIEHLYFVIQFRMMSIVQQSINRIQEKTGLSTTVLFIPAYRRWVTVDVSVVGTDHFGAPQLMMVGECTGLIALRHRFSLICLKQRHQQLHKRRQRHQ